MYIWMKSSRSGSNNCVEIASNVDSVRAVRDSKDPEGPVLTFGPSAFGTFVRSVKSGALDR